MPTAAEQYQQALALVKAGKYGAALTILKDVQHPKARELEAKIRAKMESDFETPPVTSSARPQTAKARKTPGYRKYTLPMLIVLGAVVLVIAVSFGLEYRQSMHDADVYGAVFGVCLKVYDIAQSGNCRAFSHDAIDTYKTEIEYCYDQSKSGELEQQFISCLADNGVKI